MTESVVRDVGPTVLSRSKGLSSAVVKQGTMYVLLIITTIVIGFPFFYMLTTAFKTLAEVYTVPLVWIPQTPHLQNFVDAWTKVPFGRFTVNSLIYACGITIGEFLMGLTAGYAFGRLRFPKKDVIFFIILLAFMIPGQVTLIPRFVMLRDLQWINTFQGLMIPELSSAFAVFLLREHFKSLPTELFESARIDGAGHMRQMLQIALPLSIPISVTLLLLAFVAHWNEYLWPLIVTNTADMRVLPIGVQSLKYLYTDLPQWHIVMAGAVMVVIPLVLLFLVAQRQFIEGAVQGALKG